MELASWPTARGLGLVAGLAFTVGSLLYLRLSRERVLSPVGLFLLVLVVWFGLRAVFVTLEPEFLRFNAADEGSDRWPAVLYAVILVILWAAVAVVTYHSRVGDWFEKQVERVPLLRRDWSDTAIRRVLFLYVLGLGGKVYRIATGTFVAVQQARPESGAVAVQAAYSPILILLNTVLPIIGTAALVLLVVLAVRDRRWRLLALVLALELAYAYLTAARGGLIVTGALAVLALRYWGRLSTRSVVILSGAGLLAAFALVGPYRAFIMTLDLSASETVAPSQAFGRLAQGFEVGFGRVLSAPLEFAEHHVLSRFSGLDRLAGSIRSIWAGKVGFAGGETFSSGIVWAVPRLLWPERPVLNLGGWFPVTYLGFPASNETAIPMPRVAEFYVNFGIAGVAFGGAVMGILLRSIRGLLKVRTTTSLALFLFLTIRFILVGEKPFSQIFTLWKPMLIFLICLWAMTWRFKSYSKVPSQPCG